MSEELEPLDFVIQLDSPRSGANDRYHIHFSDELGIRVHRTGGMGMKHAAHDGGDEHEPWRPGKTLMGLLIDEYMSAPDQVESDFAAVWDEWRRKEISNEEAEELVNQIAAWINVCTNARPTNDFWDRHR